MSPTDPPADAAEASLASIEVADVATTSTGSICSVLTYRVPPDLLGCVSRGAVVTVTVNEREVVGYVLKLRCMEPADPLYPRLVDIRSVPEGACALTDSERELAEWMASRWLCTMADAIRAIKGPYLQAGLSRVVALTPAGTVAPLHAVSDDAYAVLLALQARGGATPVTDLQAVLKPQRLRRALDTLETAGLIAVATSFRANASQPRWADAVTLGSSGANADKRLTTTQLRVIATLERLTERHARPVLIADLVRAAETTRDVVNRMVARGALIRETVRVRRVPQGVRPMNPDPPELTDMQSRAVRAVLDEMRAPPGDRRAILLHGVTGSGKTEVYLAAIQAALSAGRGAILVVPEIALTTQIVDVVAGRFGEHVALLHSRLGAGERYDEWARVSDGDATVAVGARSAVFAPVRNLGLVILDEEHEPSYKQDGSPRYHARDVALRRALDSDATVVLGSATPALETHFDALRGHHRLVTLPSRVGGRPLPDVQIVDMREEFATGPCLFGAALRERIAARLDAREQIVLFLNRRGYSQFVLCRDCGYVARCSQCSVSLTFHAGDRMLRCHHCGAGERPPDVCPQCRGYRLRGFGLGTERVEQEVESLFPSARIARMDRDTTSRKGSHGSIVQRIRSGEADILIGTQMVAKGLDFPGVTLVGVVSADTGLHIPDFRASERTFQLLAQVAGRAGRGDRPGEVVIQTFTPDHYAIQCAAMQDYGAFYANEIEHRRELGYPPFSSLANLVSTDAEERVAQTAAQSAAVALRDLGGGGVEVLGPSPAPLTRLKGRYRWHVVVRGSDHAAVVGAVQSALPRLKSSERSALTVDIDPLGMS